MSYIHGFEMIIPGLDKALAGRSAWDTFNVSIETQDAYRERHDDLIQDISRSVFPEGQEIVPGMQFPAQTGDGTQLITVVEVGDDQATIDANHPLVGEHLTFEIEVTGVHKVTKEGKSRSPMHTPDEDYS